MTLLEKYIAKVEEMKKPRRCTRENGCGLPFIQGRECYDGDLCEDVEVESQYNQALTKVQSLLPELIKEVEESVICDNCHHYARYKK